MGLEINEDGLLVLQSTGWEKLEVPKPEKALKYAISGDHSQVLTFKLAQGEALRTEPGIMLYTSGGISPESECAGCFSRCCAGEDCCVVDYRNTSDNGSDEFIACAPSFPTAKVIPVDLVSSWVVTIISNDHVL